MRYDKGDDQLNAWSVTKSVGKKLKKLHLDLPRKYKNKQVLDLKIIIYYVYQIQWVIRVGKNTYLNLAKQLGVAKSCIHKRNMRITAVNLK